MIDPQRIDDPVYWILIALLFWAIVVFRYFVIAGWFHRHFHQQGAERWRPHKINDRPYSGTQVKKEIFWSVLTSAIFAGVGVLCAWLWAKGYTQVYLELSWWDLLWIPFSLGLAMLLHETYYYWVHRWMHHPAIFRYVHKVHHESLSTSAWTAFSFHPWEGLIEALIMPLILVLIPLHPITIVIHLLIMTFSSVVNHLDIELYPRSWGKKRLMRYLIGATHHSLHHRQFQKNYGLYFTFWDDWMKTESKDFDRLFEEKAR